MTEQEASADVLQLLDRFRDFERTISEVAIAVQTDPHFRGSQADAFLLAVIVVRMTLASVLPDKAYEAADASA